MGSFVRRLKAVAVRLNELLGLDGQVVINQGNALSMPYPDQHFDGAYSMNVSVNIEDTAGLYQELYRVLKPGGWLLLSELALGSNGQPDYPTPWAQTSASSFLATTEQTAAELVASGFMVESIRDTVDETLAFGASSREMVLAATKNTSQSGEADTWRYRTTINGKFGKSDSAGQHNTHRSGLHSPKLLNMTPKSHQPVSPKLSSLPLADSIASSSCTAEKGFSRNATAPMAAA